MPGNDFFLHLGPGHLTNAERGDTHMQLQAQEVPSKAHQHIYLGVKVRCLSEHRNRHDPCRDMPEDHEICGSPAASLQRQLSPHFEPQNAAAGYGQY